jgi:hypothetical protein
VLYVTEGFLRGYYVVYRLLDLWPVSLLPHLHGLEVIQIIHLLLDYLETLKMEEASSPETLVSYQKITTSGNEPKAFRQFYALHMMA